MNNWPKVIKIATKGLALAEIDKVAPPLEASLSHDQYLFNCVLQMQTQSKGLKIVSNFAMAALHMGTILKVRLFNFNNKRVCLIQGRGIGISHIRN
jgi:hypothetical protein